MQALRHARLLARFVLACFALSVALAAAAPLVAPRSVDFVCSASGLIKIVVQSEDGSEEPAAHLLDCPLCAQVVAPPPVASTGAAAPDPLSNALRPLVAAHIAWLAAAPLPARGPPSAS